MKDIKYLLMLFFFSLSIVSCEDLEVENENDPDADSVLSNASDVEGVASGLFNTWYIATAEYDGPALAMWVMADAGTCSWGNAGMRDLSSEPREAFDNTSTYSNAVINNDFYVSMYSVLTSSNAVLNQTINNGLEIEIDSEDVTDRVSAVAYLVQGLSLGYLGLMYDQAYIVTHETEDITAVELSSYTDLLAVAISSLDNCIALCEASSFTVDDDYIPLSVELDQDGLKALASSYAARILSMAPRNSTENAAVDWTAVYDYASDGISTDFEPIADDVTWYNLYHTYANYSGWGRTDMRIVNMMDSSMPDQWPDGGFDDLPDPVTEYTDGVDNRIVDNFEYLDYNSFYESRGTYHFSCYRFSGRDEYLSTWTEAMPEFLVAENDLLKAEAAMHLGDYSEAAEIINAGTRVSNGGLDEISATESDVDDAIFHERMVELFCTSMGLEYFTMRKDDLHQEGTMLHFPIPGEQLDANDIDYYTFGGTTGVAGEDYSDGTGSWK
jgi:PKD repeat protein